MDWNLEEKYTNSELNIATLNTDLFVHSLHLFIYALIQQLFTEYLL